MRRIAFIDAAHHKETKSSRFLLDFLSPFFEIDVYWDGSHLGELKPDVTVIEQDNYDIIFIFQIGTDLNVYSRIDCRSIVCVPPLFLNENYESENFPRNFKYLCLSKAQHRRLSLMGRESKWFQYYPNPFDFDPYR
ncbi:MAG: hypothetical protein R3250_13660, partial [Melioribacteraceae bacterium]|nr:hypothetical protein [Melioribacteraceae bacterium]